VQQGSIPIPQGVFAKTSKDAFYSHLLRNAININTDKVKAPYLPSFLATLLAVLIG